MNNEQKQTLAVLQTAIQLEIDGKKFYEQLSRTGSNPTGRKLFGILAGEEDLHLQKFKQIYQSIESNQGWPVIRVEAGHAASVGIFTKPPAGTLGATSAELKSVGQAIDMEVKTLDYYKAQFVKAVYPAEKKYYEELAGQERIHQMLLLDYSEFLKDPAQWFTMKEHHSLDGG